MTISNNKDENTESADFLDTEFWDTPILDDNLENNQRIATRYIRDDIELCIKKSGFLNFGKPAVLKLIDISSKGVLFSTEKKLKLNKQITLSFTFKDNKQYEIKATVVRREFSTPVNFYGVKFKRFSHELGDHLLDTQNDLNFSWIRCFYLHICCI